ncbi:chaplin family protein [Agromyces binzhouensis]|uniref:chaplin family protein n=1 Tax=Agromyces binzhouensis TaxID=1817495 RepID=UPI00364530EF
MHTYVSRALTATLFTGGLMLLGAGVAHATESTGEDGILSGTQVGISIDLPVTIGGNALSVIGDAESTDSTTEVVTDDAASAEPVAVTSGDDGIGSGSQAVVDVSAPVTIGGNAVSVIGDSHSEDATTEVTTGTGSGTEAWTTGEDSILGGTQALVGLDAPITIGGNAVSVIGDSHSEGSTTVVTPGGPTDPIAPTDPVDPVDPTEPTTPGSPGDGGDSGSAGSGGSGTTVAAMGTASIATGSGSLASTGLDAGFWERLALFLLLTGGLLVGARRFAARR